MAKYKITGTMTVRFSSEVECDDASTLPDDVAKWKDGVLDDERLADYIDPVEMLNLGDVEYEIDEIEVFAAGKFVSVI